MKAATTLLLALCVAGCAMPGEDESGGSTPARATGPIASALDLAAAEAGVPADLLRAIAVEEQGLSLPPTRAVARDELIPVGGRLELRHGRLDTLAMGARLLATTEEELQADTELATRAGALVLAELGAETGAGDDLSSWRPALEALSGMDDRNARDYASRVLRIVRAGGAFAAHGGEIVPVAAHAEIDQMETVEELVLLPASAEYPGAIWFETSCANKCTPGRPLGNDSVDKIVIHDTEGGWNASVATLQYDSGKSVHYIIDADGSRVGQFRPESDTTWHAGNYYYNETSVGIEHVGFVADPGYASELYDRSRDLVASIRTRWTVPLDRTHVVGHYQIPNGNVVSESSAPCTDTLDACETSASFGGAGNHRDPGYRWQWCQYMDDLGGSCTCNDAWSLWNCTTDLSEAVRCKDGQVEIAQCADGCEVKEIGVDDLCHGATSGDGDTGDSDTGDGGDDTGDGGGGDGSGTADGPTENGMTGGCAAAGGGDGLLALAFVGVVAVLARRRRRK